MAEETMNPAVEPEQTQQPEAPKAEVKETKKPSLNASVAPEDFDWYAFEGGSEIYGKNDRK